MSEEERGNFGVYNGHRHEKSENTSASRFLCMIFPQKCGIHDCFEYMAKGCIFNSQAQLG